MESKYFGKISLKLNLKILGILMILGFILIMMINKDMEKKETNYHLVRLKDNFSGRVYDLYYNKNIFINLNNILFIRFYDMKNNSKDTKSFVYFVQYNDSLVKHSNSDTIYLYRDNKEYHFILNDLHKTLPE